MSLRSERVRIVFLSALASLALLAAGCGPEGAGGPGRAASSQPADANASAASRNPFGPLVVPAGFDPAKARLTLAQLPDDPSAPGRSTTRPAALPDAARRRLEEARRLFAEQRYSETIIEAEKAVRYEPANAEGHRLMALASLLSGNDSRAKLSAERALTIDPSNLACLYVLARFADKSDKKDDAIRAYRTAIKCEPLDDDRPYRALSQYYLGRLLFNAGYHTAAAQQLEAFEETTAAMGDKVADNPELATVARVHRGEAALLAARSRGYMGQYAAAADALKRVVSRGSRDFDVRAEYIRMLVRAKRIDAATQQATDLLAESEGSADAVQLLVGVYNAAGHPERALAAIKSVVARQPENTELWLVYVDTLWASGKTNEAFHAVRDLLSRHPDSIAARWKLVALDRQRQDWAGWAAQIAEYLAADPGQRDRVLAELQQIPADAIPPLLDRFDAAQPAASQPSGVLASSRDLVRGQLLERLDRVDDARKSYAAALSRTPDFMPVTLAAGELYLNRCRWKEAAEILESAQKSREKPSSEVEFLLARAHDGLDQIADAVTHYGKAIQIDRGYVRAIVALAHLHERIGNELSAQHQYQAAQQLYQAAVQQYQAAISADATYMPAREGLIHLLLSQMSGRSEAREQQTAVNSILGGLAEMQKTAPQDPATLRTTALVQFLFSRNQKEYLQTLQKLVQQHPDEQQTREDLVRAMLEAHEYEPAQKVVRELLARDRFSANGLEMSATLLLRRLQFEDAAREYEHMLELYPNREPWLQQYAELQSLLRRYDGALATYERALKLDRVEDKADRELVYREKLTQIYRRTRQFDKARTLAEKWLSQVKEDRFRQSYRGFLLTTDLAAEDYERYLARCRGWLKQEPDSSELHRLLIVGLIKADRPDEGIAEALEWLSHSPDEDRLDWVSDVLQFAHRYAGAIEIARGLLSAAEKPEIKRGRLGAVASLLIAAKRYDPGIVALRQLILQGQGSAPDVYVYELQKMLSRVYVQADRPEEAVRLLNKLLNDVNEELTQRFEQFDLGLQKIKESSASDEDKKKAAYEFDRAKKLAQLSANPRKADLLRQMYWAYQHQGQIDVAEQRLREAMALAPGEPGICNDLGYTLADSGRGMSEAKRLVGLAVGEEPSQAAYLDSYGWVLYKMGDFKEARTWLERASGLEAGEDPVIFDHLGDAQWRTGDKKAAVESWKRSLQIREKESQEGETGAEKDLPERVQRKLNVVEAGRIPPVAPTASKPAE